MGSLITRIDIYCFKQKKQRIILTEKNEVN